MHLLVAALVIVFLLMFPQVLWLVLLVGAVWLALYFWWLIIPLALAYGALWLTHWVLNESWQALKRLLKRTPPPAKRAIIQRGALGTPVRR